MEVKKLCKQVTFTKVEKLFLTSYLKGIGRQDISWRRLVDISSDVLADKEKYACFEFDADCLTLDVGEEKCFTQDMSDAVNIYLSQLAGIDCNRCQFSFNVPDKYYDRFLFGAALYHILCSASQIIEENAEYVVSASKRGKYLQSGEYYGTLKVISYNEKYMIVYHIKLFVTEHGSGVTLVSEPSKVDLYADVLATSLDAKLASESGMSIGSGEDHEYRGIQIKRDLDDSLEDEER